MCGLKLGLTKPAAIKAIKITKPRDVSLSGVWRFALSTMSNTPALEVRAVHGVPFSGAMAFSGRYMESDLWASSLK